MSLEECRAIWTASKAPDFYVTKRSICFGGGPDGTVSLCRVSSHTGSLMLIDQVTLKHSVSEYETTKFECIRTP